MIAERDALEDLLEAFRSRGLRVTEARRAVVSRLCSHGEHLTSDALVEDVRQNHPGVGRATVYRTLAVLAELGLVRNHRLDDGPVRYHLAGRRHEHLVCERCDRVVSVPAEVFAPLVRELRSDYGFVVGEHRTMLTGWCAGCAGVRTSRRRA